AMSFPQVYASIRVSYDGHARRRAFGSLGMTSGSAAIAGQVSGGWIVHADSFGSAWRTIFSVNVPVGSSAWRSARHIPESRDAAGAPMDWGGSASVGAGSGSLSSASVEGPARHWPTWTSACGAASVALSASFVWMQRRAGAAGRAPSVDMTSSAQPRFAAGCSSVTSVFSTASAMFLCYASSLQTGSGVDASTAGTVFAPASVGFVAGSMAAPRSVARFGTHAVTVAASSYGGATATSMWQVGAAGAALAPAHADVGAITDSPQP
ncbi:hypothetical protein OY671_008579, partial [Metschnikowia pulcherrima]